MIDFARPGDIRNVDHSIQTFLKLNERAIAGKVSNLAFNFGARRVLLLSFVPRVGFELSQAQGDFLLFTINTQDYSFNFLVLFEHVRGFGNTLGPGQLSDVDQPFYTRFQFDERAVRHEVDHLAFDLGTHWIFLLDRIPWIGQLLLQAKADALLFAVDVENNDIDVLPDSEKFGRMTDASPAHISDVEQAIDSVQIDKRAEIRDILDGAFANIARCHLSEEFLTAFEA